MSDHTHHQWQSTTVNVTEEAIAEELLQELFTTVILQQDHEAAATSCFVFMFIAVAYLVTDEFN